MRARSTRAERSQPECARRAAQRPQWRARTAQWLVRWLARCGLAAGLAIWLSPLPALAAGAQPVGWIDRVHAAYVDNQDAARGTSVFAGDRLETSPAGTLTLHLGGNWFQLQATSIAFVDSGGAAARLRLAQGTLRFALAEASAQAPGDARIQTPIAALRAAKGQAATGDLTLAGPQAIVVSVREGALLIERPGESHVVAAGKSYRISLAPAAEANPALPAQTGQGSGIQNAMPSGTLIFRTVVFTAAGAVAWCLWGMNESPSGFCD